MLLENDMLGVTPISHASCMAALERAVLKARLDDAHRLLALAQDGLQTAMQELKSPDGVDKTMIAKTLEDSFEKLRAARRDVAELEELLEDGE